MVVSESALRDLDLCDTSDQQVRFRDLLDEAAYKEPVYGLSDDAISPEDLHTPDQPRRQMS